MSDKTELKGKEVIINIYNNKPVRKAKKEKTDEPSKVKAFKKKDQNFFSKHKKKIAAAAALALLGIGGTVAYNKVLKPKMEREKTYAKALDQSMRAKSQPIEAISSKAENQKQAIELVGQLVNQTLDYPACSVKEEEILRNKIEEIGLGLIKYLQIIDKCKDNEITEVFLAGKLVQCIPGISGVAQMKKKFWDELFELKTKVKICSAKRIEQENKINRMSIINAKSKINSGLKK